MALVAKTTFNHDHIQGFRTILPPNKIGPQKVNTEIAKMEIGLQSVANGSALKSFQKQNDFTVVENHQKMSHFFGQISFLQF